MNVILFDKENTWKNLLPLTYTRPVSEIRVGILTLKEKWDLSLETKCSYLTQNYLQKKFSLVLRDNSLFILSNVGPDKALTEAVKNLKPGQCLIHDNEIIAFVGGIDDMRDLSKLSKIEYKASIFRILHVWDIFRKNGEAINSDFGLVTKGRKSQPISDTVTVVGEKEKIFIEKGAFVEACIINTTGGYIYIGRDAEVMEGSAIRGPLAVCEYSTLRLNAKVYGPTTIGPHSKVGGEVSNCVIFGYSNKAHDGFIGNSVLGEWCNLGADTNSSNLKNNYSDIKLYNYVAKKQTETGLQFCGLIMGDHSKCGINTMFNTGTVVGVAANIFGGGFPLTHIPSFSWGGPGGFETYHIEKMLETAKRVVARRNIELNETEKEILNEIFKISTEYRHH